MERRPGRDAWQPPCQGSTLRVGPKVGWLPPLGLLPALATGAVTPGMRAAIDMTRRLKSELPRMLVEHKAIVAALEKLVDESHRAQRPEIAAFAEKLMLHAQTEEEVLYPTAILIGEFLETRLGK